MRLGIVESIPLVDSWAIVIKEFRIGLDLPSAIGAILCSGKSPGAALILADMAT